MFDHFTQTRITANGISIHLVHGGNGPPLLLLHGYPQTHVEWHKIAPRLAQHYRVVAPDLRGYGDSDKPPASDDDLHVYCKRTTAQDQVEDGQTAGVADRSQFGYAHGLARTGAGCARQGIGLWAFSPRRTAGRDRR